MITNGLTMATDFKVEVHTTKNRGFTPEEVASRCADKIISISNKANPVLQQQAHAFKDNMEAVIALYLKQAIQSDRTTIYNALNDAGEPKLADLIRRL
tara:strand:- start:608 stop:901 length:294 start_codon:yes stop_codon:yes gene_type:complete